ncbi:hypothetical protein COO60DRAFT_1629987 [Scenedesmus sp. NREL 46B-D3]|nr:hypothetical protein COO60DRAFT_1629987 [Scenedesmus sp. NREL 46B-D3]
MQDQGLPVDMGSSAGGSTTKAGSQAEWYRGHLKDPLWACQGENSKLQIHQAVFMLMSWKSDFCVRDGAFEALLGMMSKLFLPEGNKLPPSYYLMKAILEVQDISSVEWHACEVGCTGWEPTPKAQWHKHKHDHCQKCKGKRFKTVMGKLVPVRRFWFVLPEDSIKELMSDPEFVAALLAAKVARVGSFWASSEFNRLNKAVSGVLTSTLHGVIELGFDFAQPYNFVQHSTGLMFMRAKLNFSIGSFLAYFACPFCKLAGTLRGKTVRFLGYCLPVLTPAGVGKGKWFQMGASDGRLLQPPEQIAQAIAAAFNRARGFQPPPGNRYKGYSLLLRDLYWVHPSRLFVVPFCHAFHLGIFKDLMHLLFGKEARSGARDEGGTAAANPLRIPNDRRQVIRGRVEQMRLHPSFNRRFRSPFTSKASWQIEECARALQCFLPVCFRPVRRGSSKEEVLQPDLAKKAYGHLKRFAAFHLGHEGFDTQQEYVAAAIRAHQELLEYGKLVEQHVAEGEACTFNLHLLACQLLQQALERGATYEQFELWVERLIGDFKQRVKLRTRAEPEKTMMADDMLKRALQRWRLQFSELQTWHEYSGQAQRQRRYVLGDEVGQLLGTGQQAGVGVWTEAVQRDARNAVLCNADVVGGEAEQQLWLDNWDAVTVEWFTEALLPGGFYATSTLFSRSRSRDGSFVVVPYAEGDESKPWVGRVNRYLRVSLPAPYAQQLQRSGHLLFAVCDLLPYRQPYEDPDICGNDSMILYGKDTGARESTYSHLDYPVLLSCIYAPAFRQDFVGADGQAWWAFVPLKFRTGGKR